MLQHREPGNPTAGWAQPVIFHDAAAAAAIKCTTTVGHWSASDLVGKRGKKIKSRRMLNVVTQVVRFPNCLECPVASVLGNLTITQVASAGGADESSSKKVKATMRMLLRREVRRHTLISVGQRGRGRHLLSEGLSPKVGG